MSRQPLPAPLQESSAYGMSVSLPGTTVDDAVTAVTEALGTEGFGVLTTIDVQATLKSKLDEDIRPYRILGACNPKLAHQAVMGDADIGLLLPCNVVVEQTDEGARVVIVDPGMMTELSKNDAITPIADAAREKLVAVLQKLVA